MRVGIASLLCLATGVISALFVSSDAGTWFASLNKPPLTPPAWSFPLILAIKYSLLATAASLMWLLDDDSHLDFHGWIPGFFAHLVVNAGWVIFFFGFHKIFLALLTVVVLCLYVLLLMVSAWDTSKTAFGIFVAYFAWTLYVLMVNLGIWLRS